MRYKAHIGFVNAHAKSNGGHHDHPFIAKEAILVLLSDCRIQSCVVGQGINARLGQHLCHFFNSLSRLTIHHTGIALVFTFYEAKQLRAGLFFFNDGVTNVGAVKAADKKTGIFQLQPLDDVGSGECIGCGCQGHPGHARITFVQNREASILGPEIVAPLTHTMRLVDGKQTQLAMAIKCVHLRQEAGRVDAFGRGIQQGDLAAHQLLLNGQTFLGAERGV